MGKSLAYQTILTENLTQTRAGSISEAAFINTRLLPLYVGLTHQHYLVTCPLIIF